MQVFDTPGSVSLYIKLQSGRVKITTADGPQTTVELVAAGLRGPDDFDNIVVTCEERRGGHVVSIEQRDKFRWGPIGITWGEDFEVRITCPPGADLDLAGGSTDLRVDGDLGAVSAKTASGDVKLDAVLEKLQLKTASGDIRIGSLQSGGTLNTMSGDVEIRLIAAGLTARSVSGDVEITSLQAPLDLATTSGDVAVDSIASGELRLQSVSGDVKLGIARGTRVWIDAVSISGDLDSQLGVADSVPEGAGEESGEVVPLHVKTVSGDVQIVRAAEVFTT
jgi:Putative adhesin